MLKPTVPIDDLHHGDETVPSGGLAAGSSVVAQPPNLYEPTSDEILGPFYPTNTPADQCGDLTYIAGKTGRALGSIVYLSGRVLNRRGEPVPNAELDIWQANAAGRYAHPADENPAPIDPNFEGHARIRTGPDGSWRIKTVKPGGYPVTPDWSRPPHIHFDARGQVSRLVTQMYFEGESLNEKDILLQRTWGKETLIARYLETTGSDESKVLVAQWDIVLLGG